MLLDYDARNYLMTAGIVSPEEWRREKYLDLGEPRDVLFVSKGVH